MTRSGPARTLRIDRLGHLGDGVAQGPAGDVFVPRALPGETVEGSISGARMGTPRILIPSPERVPAPCPHFEACGGCALQHLGDASVAAWKTAIVQTALSGRDLQTVVRPMTTSPERSRRRAVLTGRRIGKTAVVGFHAPAAHRVTAIPDCRLLHPALLAALPVLERLVHAGAGRKRDIAFTVTRSLEGLDINARGGRPLDAGLRERLVAVTAQPGAGEAGIARLVWNDEPLLMRAPPSQAFGPARVVPPPGAFLQATMHGEAALLRAVAEALGGSGTRSLRVADLFCGCGTFALPLAQRHAVHAVEGDAEMVSALLAGARMAPGLRPVTAEARDLFRRPLLASELARLDAVVIDPPRPGAEAQTAEIARSRVPVVVMMSCNPVTFARDAGCLVDAGYRLDWVQPVDQFRWSAHVELAARLVFDHIAR